MTVASVPQGRPPKRLTAPSLLFSSPRIQTRPGCKTTNRPTSCSPRLHSSTIDVAIVARALAGNHNDRTPR